MTASTPRTIVVIGDIHARLDIALAELIRIEGHYGAIDQVFSVGDVGLFLEPDDWNYLTGPKKHRHPEWSERIAGAWKEWRWPLAMIGGNHEPYQRLRTFDSAHFGPKLTYINAGVLTHQIQGLRVYGLSGIYHPEHLSFSVSDRPGEPKPRSWENLLGLTSANKASLKRLTYYKQEEIELLLRLPREPDLLLMHDWPIAPPHIASGGDRPEKLLVERLRPKWVCSGHHHAPAEFTIGTSNCIALNILAGEGDRKALRAWAVIFRWTGPALERLALWQDSPAHGSFAE